MILVSNSKWATVVTILKSIALRTSTMIIMETVNPAKIKASSAEVVMTQILIIDKQANTKNSQDSNWI